jgi:hypothetical protein
MRCPSSALVSAIDWRLRIEIGARDFKDGADFMPNSRDCTVAEQFQQGMDLKYFE